MYKKGEKTETHTRAGRNLELDLRHETSCVYKYSLCIYMYTPARGVEIGISPGLRYSLAVRAQRNKCFGDIILHAPRGRVRAISLSLSLSAHT